MRTLKTFFKELCFVFKSWFGDCQLWFLLGRWWKWPYALMAQPSAWHMTDHKYWLKLASCFGIGKLRQEPCASCFQNWWFPEVAAPCRFRKKFTPSWFLGASESKQLGRRYVYLSFKRSQGSQGVPWPARGQSAFLMAMPREISLLRGVTFVQEGDERRSVALHPTGKS